MKTLTDAEIEGTHYNEEAMKRRLKLYRTANESQVAEPSLSDFFQKQDVRVFTQDCVAEKKKVFDALKIYVERIEKPFNYMTYEEDTEGKRREEVKLESEWKAHDSK